MYKVKPVQEKLVISNLPTSMYKTKPYFNENELAFDDHLTQSMSNLSLNQTELEELNKQQNRQFRRLERLLNRSNELCEDLNLNNLVLSNVSLHSSGSKQQQQQPALSTGSQDQDRLQAIYNKQQTQFTQIYELGSKLNKICEELKLNSLVVDFNSLNLNTSQKQTSKSSQTQQQSVKVQRKKLQVDLSQFKDVQRATTKANQCSVEDFVIHLDPQNLPYELFSLFDLLTKSHKCFIKFHLHGSVSGDLTKNSELENKLHNVVELFDALKLGVNESRLNYDFGFTFIWKKLGQTGPQLSSTNGSTIDGEANIIEKVNSLLPENHRITMNSLKSHQNSSPLFKLLKTF